MNKGIIYIIGGRKFSKWTLQSVLSLRRNGGMSGNLPVHIHFLGDCYFVNQFNQLSCTCIHHPRKDPKESFTCLHRRERSLIMQETPFDKFVMLDSDTFIQGDFIDFFELTPDSGIGGAEDGKFENHLQMARNFFLRKKISIQETREVVKRLLNVDYGEKKDFPVYYNCGSVCFSKSASIKIGIELFKVLRTIQDNKLYNNHDDQLPFNSVVYRLGIEAASLDPAFNYTRSRMQKNKSKGIHEEVKSCVKIIHNRHYPKEADWINVNKIHEECDKMIN